MYCLRLTHDGRGVDSVCPHFTGNTEVGVCTKELKEIPKTQRVTDLEGYGNWLAPRECPKRIEEK